MAAMSAMGYISAQSGAVGLSSLPSVSGNVSTTSLPVFVSLKFGKILRSSRRFCSCNLVYRERNNSRFSSGFVRVRCSGVKEAKKEEDSSGFFEKLFLSSAVALSPLLVDLQNAYAAQGEFGLLEGRSVALVHPLVMGGLFFFTLWSGYLGWQWRRVRTVQEEIVELKKQIPVPAGDSGTVSSASPVEVQINNLSEERKKLIKGGYRDRHFNAGSLLLGFGVLSSVGGGLNTYLRVGKLFPGPHLFAGAGITILWALAASLVPAMQKGSDTARNLHIALNTLNVALFLWQIPTGLEIVGKVFEFTNWP